MIFDTNAILMMFEFSIDVEQGLKRLLGSYEIYVPEAVYDELQVLAHKTQGKQAQNAAAGLQLIKKYHSLSSSNGYVDERIVDLAVQLNAHVVTNDRELRKKLKKKGVSVIILRGKHVLQFDS